jgi:acyl-CoA dehydrogenase
VAEQLLLASATTEIGIGGDVRTKATSSEPRAGSPGQETPVISYGAQADVVMTTARRAADTRRAIRCLPAWPGRD